MLYKLKTSATKEFLTMLTVLINVLFVTYLMYTLISQCCHEKRVSKNRMVTKIDILRQSFSSSLRKKSFSLRNKSVNNNEVNVDAMYDTSRERFGSSGEVKIAENNEMDNESVEIGIEMSEVVNQERVNPVFSEGNRNK